MDVSVANGLSEDEAKHRFEFFGSNKITTRRKVSAFAVLLHQFSNPVVYLLAAAAGLALYFGERQEAAAIAAVLALNALIGFVTEIKAARSIEALQGLGTRSARIRRDGHTRMIPAEQLVPGDIVLLEGAFGLGGPETDRSIEPRRRQVDADRRIRGGRQDARPVTPDARLADRTSMLFKGTAIAAGSGVGVAVATGLADRARSNFRTGRGGRTGKVAAGEAACATVRPAHLGHTDADRPDRRRRHGTGKDAFLMVEAAIALAVAAIPEGLPIVATLTLGRGMWRMARQNALIERLSAVETLGATTVILTDKTGTLTENRMTVRRFWVPAGEVDAGTPDSGASSDAECIGLRNDPQLRRLLEIAVLCNNATLGQVADEDSGDPMELALLRAGRGARLDALRAAGRVPGSS